MPDNVFQFTKKASAGNADVKGFQIKAKSADVAEIYIYAQIGTSWWDEAISQSQFKTELDKVKDAKELIIRISSPGGDVFDGWAIYNQIKRHGAKKKTAYIDGMAASIASIIMLACDEVVMGEGAMIMIHRAASGRWGHASDQEDLASLLHSIDAQLISTYVNKTKKDRATIQSLVNAETWFNADEAMEIGLADKKTEEKAKAVAMSTLIKSQWLNSSKIPKNLRTEADITKEEIKKFKDSITETLARSKNAAQLPK